MGSKLSVPGGDPTARCPGTEDIHTAYKEGDPSRARHLLKEAYDETTSQLERVRSTPAPPAKNEGARLDKCCRSDYLFAISLIVMGIFYRVLEIPCFTRKLMKAHPFQWTSVPVIT